jgi:enamine deaminase RidA (YjgF/YER057c/UK114 family)
MADPTGTVEYLNPPELPVSRAFSNVVVTSGHVRTVYVGAQTATDASGQLVGPDDVAAQTEQVLRNIEACLRVAGAELGHIVLWTIYLKEGVDIGPAFGVFQRHWGDRPNPPANTVFQVSGLPNPGWLLSIDAIAAIPE